MSEYSPKIKEAKVEYLPDEILIAIVLRLPIKSIISWTSVSKSWNSLIKNPNFIYSHLNHTHTNLLLIGRDRWYRYRTLVDEVAPQINLHWDNEAFDEYTRFDFPFYSPSDYRRLHFNPVGTCNGLVCFDNVYNFFVWNPCIRKYVIIPTANATPNLTLSGSLSVGLCDVYDSCNGFGFDSKTNDYKVVRVVTFVDKGQSPPKVDVYSLATGKWKMVTALPPTCLIRKLGLQAFVNGALHWPILRRTNGGYHNFVLVFDLGDEDFRELMLPKDLLVQDNSFDLSLSVCGESLAVFHKMYFHNSIHVWVMKEYGVLESWTKVLTVDTEGPEVQVPRIFDFFHNEDDVLLAVGFRKSGEVVIEMEMDTLDREGKLLSIDSKSKEIKDLSKKINNLRVSGEGHSTTIDPYVQSLVLLDKFKDAVSY